MRRLSTNDPFWRHFAHLAVTSYDDDGRPIRVLDVKGCEACRRLWAALWPIGSKFPAAVGVGVAGLYVRADVLDVVKATASTTAPPSAEETPAAVQRLEYFTEDRARRARLEHY